MEQIDQIEQSELNNGIQELKGKIALMQNELKHLENLKWDEFMQITPEDRLKYAIENFDVIQDFAGNFTMKNDDYTMIKMDVYAEDEVRYLVQNKNDLKCYFIDFHTCIEDPNKIFIGCREDHLRNRFIDKYPHIDFAQLNWNEEKTRELAIENNLENAQLRLPMRTEFFRNNIFTYKNRIFQFNGIIYEDDTSFGNWD